MNRIYTKTGDKGQTRLVGGSLVSKSDLRLEAYGTIDELNSILGLCRSLILSHSKFTGEQEIKDDLYRVQNELFNIGSILANEDSAMWPHLPQIREDQIQKLELSIDRMTAQLEPLKNFILPGGTLLAAHLHIARTVARRAEREMAKEPTYSESPYAICQIYINRLSDYLFTLARFANLKDSHKEELWQKT
jgi:cob(I)alamin adenosyltransferase